MKKNKIKIRDERGKRRQETSSDSDSAAVSPAEKPISLHPLEFEDALSDLLKTGRSSTGEKKNE